MIHGLLDKLMNLSPENAEENIFLLFIGKNNFLFLSQTFSYMF